MFENIKCRHAYCWCLEENGVIYQGYFLPTCYITTVLYYSAEGVSLDYYSSNNYKLHYQYEFDEECMGYLFLNKLKSTGINSYDPFDPHSIMCCSGNDNKESVFVRFVGGGYIDV